MDKRLTKLKAIMDRRSVYRGFLIIQIPLYVRGMFGYRLILDWIG